MIKKKFIFITLLSFANMVNAQLLSRSEIGIMLGGSNYVGDINNASEVSNQTFMNQFETSFDFYNVSFLAGFVYRYNISPRWVMRGNLLFTKLWGEDAHFDNMRNLSFNTWCNEASFLFEFNFFDYQTGSLRHRISPYMFVGLALFYMNPKTEIVNPYTFETEEVYLRDLSTEGQGMTGYPTTYSKWQIAIPFGLGIKFSVSDYICISLEYGFRKTFTDYLDDISTNYVGKNELTEWGGALSQAAADRTNEIMPNTYHAANSMRGNPKTKDWYNFFGITLTTKLPKSNKCEAYRNRR
ncbi:MAG: DUF6089 family protein [Bacteroidales bacterium]|jgi:opacity protein-like surface antigen|nr:DUF6089 family protein [Bacteroidales bacterium]